MNNYTGNPSNIADVTASVVVSVPQDGIDDVAASTVTTPIEKEADWLEYLRRAVPLANLPPIPVSVDSGTMSGQTIGVAGNPGPGCYVNALSGGQAVAVFPVYASIGQVIKFVSVRGTVGAGGLSWSIELRKQTGLNSGSPAPVTSSLGTHTMPAVAGSTRGTVTLASPFSMDADSALYVVATFSNVGDGVYSIRAY